MNTVLQGSAADIIKVAMVRVSRELERRRPARRAWCCRCTTSSSSRRRRTRSTSCLPLVREAMCGAYEMDPPLEVDIGVGDELAGGQVA